MPLATSPGPVTARFTTVMSQDVIQTDAILVDAQKTSPIAPFTHPCTQVPEALVISGGKLAHATRDLTGESGWRLAQLGGDAGITAHAVAAGTTYKGDVASRDPNDPSKTRDPEATLGFYQGDDALHVLEFSKDTASWGPPTQVAAHDHRHLRVAYSPLGKLVVFGATPDGDLAVAYRPRPFDPITWQKYSLPQPLPDDYALVLTGESNWTVAAEQDGNLGLYYGLLDGTSDVPSAHGQADNSGGGIKQVVTGYWSDEQSTVFFLFLNEAGELRTWSRAHPETGPPAAATVTTVPAAASQTRIVQAVGHVFADPDTSQNTLHVYIVDEDQRLSVLHQRTDQPWNEDGSPAWAGMLPLDTGISGLAVDPSPANAPSLFGMTADEFALHLHTQDTATKLWRKGKVLQSSEESFEVTRHRVEVTFRDGNGAPIPDAPVTVSLAPGSTATDVCVAGATCPLTPGHSVDLKTTAMGKLTFAVLVTTGLAGPVLLLDADGMERLTIHTADGLHNYLAGNGELNPTNPQNPTKGAGPLPAFDGAGSTLVDAKVSGQPLAPGASDGSLAQVAASAIQQVSMVGSGSTPPHVAGFALDRAGDGKHVFTLFATSDEVAAHLERRRVIADAAVAGLWSDIGDFFGDVWEGIKNGAIEIEHFVVHVADKVVSFTLKIAGEIQHAVALALEGVEHAAHFMAGVFQWVGAELEKVVDWLKALFDFGSIWRTKMAFEKAILATPAYVKAVLERAEASVDGWFGQQEAEVHKAFLAAKEKVGDKKLGDQPQFQPPGAPNAQTTVFGGATPADFTDNVHHNWLHDKVEAATGPQGVVPPAGNPAETPVQHFVDNTKEAFGDFEEAFDHLERVFDTLFRDPKSITTTGVVEFLSFIEEVVEGVLKMADAVFDGLVALLDVIMDGLVGMLTARIDVPLLPELWSWIAASAGYPDDDELTAAAVIALLGAFPTTIIFKLVAGVSLEPFPAAASPASRVAPMGQQWSNPLPWFSPPPESVLASTIVTLIGAGFSIASDAFTTPPPKWLGLVSFGLTAVAFATSVGFPDPTQINGLLEDSGIVVVGMYVGLVALKGSLPTIPDDVMNGVLCGFGVLSLIGHIAYNLYAKKDIAQIIGGVFLPLPNIFAFLSLTSVKSSPIGPYAYAGKLAIDVVGYATGGIAQLVDAAEVVHRRHPAQS
jgi:hypothetical protein